VPDVNGDGVEMIGPLMTSEKVLLAVCGVGVAESVTLTTTLLLVPAVVGVPLITPVLGVIVRPAGNPVADHV
jgi:hypothetical protein